MSPTGSETGARNSTCLILLGLAVRVTGLPLKEFDRSSGYHLPDGSVLSPDASLERTERASGMAAWISRSAKRLGNT